MGQTRRDRVYGIDFSGSSTAGKKIWLAPGVVDGGTVRVEECYPGRDLPGSGVDRETCYAALRELIESSPDAAFGLDFPFGLPDVVTDHDEWAPFATSLGDRFDGPDDLGATCDAIGAELDGDRVRYKRETDRETGAPFSPYAMRIKFQTYHGIADLLTPMVETDSARILPMQSPAPDRPWVLEVCPSSTLQAEELPHQQYKGTSPEHVETRREILRALEDAGVEVTPEVRETAIADPEGDAVDAIVATMATARAVQEGPHDLDVGAEGYIYV